MKFSIKSLTLSCKRERETIVFSGYNYFYGPMGSGKSTIARLIDYCLGGNIEYTPALQREFVAATLQVLIADKELLLTRRSQSNTINAQWNEGEDAYDVDVPARKAAGEILQNTGIAVLSDLLFYLCGALPPKVRKGKKDDDSEVIRLSFRDVFWYCYLDQESIDSSFFNLDDESNIWMRYKSRDVLRFILGFHQEKVSELEVELQEVREERMQCDTAAQAIEEALSDDYLTSIEEIGSLRSKLENDVEGLDQKIEIARQDSSEFATHESEMLREKARNLGSELGRVNDALDEISRNVDADRIHRNTLLSLSAKQRRAQFARSALIGVSFEDCPQCAQSIPVRSSEVCPLCGQMHSEISASPIDDETIEADTKSRVSELEQRMNLQKLEARRLEYARIGLMAEKEKIDLDLNNASKVYDSSYLASVLSYEKERARILQRIDDLGQFEMLVKKVLWLRGRAKDLMVSELGIREELKSVRAKAEKDTVNLELLKGLFLDCLLRSKLYGFEVEDFVEMKPPNFLPEVYGKNTGDMVTVSFANLGSGGKKTFYKCCFAVALHRLSSRIGALLPKILILDSPMKNVSERENVTQFEGFHKMLYELAQGELADTQFIIIDKEIFRPDEGFVGFKERHMSPTDPENPPLIRGYRGT